MFSAIFGDATGRLYGPGPVGNLRPFFLSAFPFPPKPLSLFSKRNRFCSRSGSWRHRPTGTRRVGLESTMSVRLGPEKTKRIRGNSTVTLAGDSCAFMHLQVSMNIQECEGKTLFILRAFQKSRDQISRGFEQLFSYKLYIFVFCLK